MSKLVPIALMVFNRPDLTIRIMDQLSKSRPPLLYVIADGPRNKEEELLCSQTREIALNPSWPCQVVPFVREENVGMVKQFKGGLDYIFEKHENVIFLEDDILLSPSFYLFACEMLERYKNSQNIGHINFSNFYPSHCVENQHDYFLSTYFLVWGFATWKKIWKSYDISMPMWKSINQKHILRTYFHNQRERKSMKKMFDLHSYNLNPWTYDYQWLFNCMSKNLFAITPSKNLSLNIGFERTDATHNFGKNPFAEKLEEVTFPIKHPLNLLRDKAFDKKISNKSCPNYFNLYFTKIKNRVDSILK
jgi:hypothetical protein